MERQSVTPPPLDLVDLTESPAPSVPNDNSIQALRSEIMQFSSMIGQFDFEEAQHDLNTDPVILHRAAQMPEARKRELVFIAQEGNAAYLQYREAVQIDPSLEVPAEVEHGRLAVGRILVADTGSIIAILRRINPNFRIPPEDLMQVAFQAYQESIYKFDFEQGTRVITYGLNAVKWGLQKYMRENSRIIRIPDGNYFPLSQIHRAMLTSNNPRPSYTEIARETGLLLSAVKRLLTLPNATSLEGIMEEKGPESLSIMADTLVDPVEELVLGRITDTDRSRHVARLLKFLNPKEQLVVTLLYGLGDDEEMRQVDIAKKLGLTRARIGQIKNSAEAKLRELFEAHGLD